MNVLLVEDDEIIQLMLVKVMEKRGHVVTRMATAEDALVCLKDNWFPLAFLDLGLPGMGGLDLSKSIRKLPRGDLTYIIVGTGEVGNHKLESILDAGADDYIGKPYKWSALEVRLAVAEKRVEEIEARSRLEAELTFLAKHDPLTRLWNRWQLDDAIQSALVNPKKSEVEGSLLLLDLDHFKEVNDACGHAVGDRLLVEVAGCLTSSLPQDSQIIRFGGDEFVAVLPHHPTSEALDITNRLAESISALDLPDVPDMIRPSASMGITSLRQGVEPRDLLKEADLACYRAKSLGKNRAEVFVRFNEKLLTPRSHSRQNRNQPGVREEDELELWFQPICDLQTGEILFQESLLRFLSSRGQNPIQATMFMSQMNDRAYVRALDRFVIHEICNSLREYPHLTASININAISITDWSFAESLIFLLDEHNISGRRLYLEVTETQGIQDLPLAQSIIRRLLDRGVRCALDDLGAGFSSIMALKTLPIDLVKVDGSLIRNLPEESFNQTFMNALHVFSVGVGFRTIAERLEKKEELEAARALGVNYGQGFLIGRPRKEPYLQEEINALHFQPSVAA